jgi:N-acyl-D-aspartate/D-glutamate deacylase
MDIDKWVRSYKVRVFPWIDGKRIYFNVQYYAPSQSIQKPPVWDKTIYIIDNKNGRNLVNNFLDSLVEHVAKMVIQENTEVVITA